MKKSVVELLANVWNAEGMKTDQELMEKVVLYEKDPSISAAFITFNAPELLNAVPIAALERVGDLVREADYDDEVKTIVIRGNGKAFGTGADASELGHYIGYKKQAPGERKRAPSQRQRILPDKQLLSGAFAEAISNSMKATICAVQGYCYGGHVKIALNADMVIATPDAQFTHPAFRYLGAAPQDMYVWIENLGIKKMKEIMLTMRPLGAEEAEQAGLVNKIVPHDELDSWVRDYCQAISYMPMDGLMIGKSMMRMVQEARGKGVGEMTAWVGHGWASNLRLEEGEFNFVKERRDKGLSQALRDRDAAVAPFFRLGGRLGEDDA
ncbi:MAG TPA: enoyl-CoA hydratase/isomerase family protein [Nocardioides sp.]|jgi:enoyl-CoA hydratase|uniref:enoyl-CoA hydratase/isomerase family protein n=1 Tax=Nocardioides sp. TaxID=35761 RepID=UPI002BC07A0A|nr:enoyl-CoA hydratase/isomerase family protein [Nocardioides sp.]HTW15818.1 enoyl-CoA hydratase/isomerase family protein [Nocardioides sp.]